MKRISLFVSALFVSVALPAQTRPTAREAVDAEPRLAVPSYTVYLDDDLQPPARPPKGYEPFYVSHFSRHGSRYQLSRSFYRKYIDLLERADSAGLLTDLGREARDAMQRLCAGQKSHSGELSALGAEQHRGIARRMYARFKPLFGRNAEVFAQSSNIMRCAFSMFYFCDGLKECEPALRIRLDAGDGVQNVLRPQERGPLYTRHVDSLWHRHLSEASEWNGRLREWSERQACPQAMSRLIADPETFEREFGISSFRFTKEVHARLAFAQNVDVETGELIGRIFSADELWLYHTYCSYQWFNSNACTDDPVCAMMISFMRPLVADFIEQADAAVSGSRTGVVDLRFAHDTQFVPLLAAMGFEGCWGGWTDVETVARQWRTSRLVTMAANVQMILYRSKRGGDVLVRFLIDERDAELPLPAVSDFFYRWSDVRVYFLQRLAALDDACRHLLTE